MKDPRIAARSQYAAEAHGWPAAFRIGLKNLDELVREAA